jgi:hypothetical protein
MLTMHYSSSEVKEMAALLRWRHGVSSAEARRIMEEQLSEAGYADQVQWDGDEFSASVGFGTVLKVKGQVTDEEIVLEKCSGALGSTVLAKIREIVGRVFPGGEVT